jgi:hypothetical protein
MTTSSSPTPTPTPPAEPESKPAALRPEQAGRARLARWGWVVRLAGLFLMVCGARLCIVHEYGFEVPFWDQWGSEGALLYKPWLEGNWHVSDLFAAHLEHRIVFSRLLALLLFQCNQQWDPLLEMTASLALTGVLAVMIAIAVRRHFRAAHRDILLVALIPIFSLPYGWENILSGFQTCFYFLLLFSLIAIWGLVVCRAGSLGWWTGALFALASCFTLGSGFFAAAAVLVLLTLRRMANRQPFPNSDLITGAGCLAVVLLGAALKTDVPAHVPLRAESLFFFLRAFGSCLAWPFVSQPLMALVFCAPLAMLAWVYWRRGSALDQPARLRWELVLAAGIWVLAQAAAASYARGLHGLPPASRYQEIFGFGLLVNLAAVLCLVEAAAIEPRRRLLASSLATGWIAAAVAGLAGLSIQNFQIDLPQKWDLSRQQQENTRAYVATGDKQYLLNRPFLTIPFPDANLLIGFLDDPTLRSILPAHIRPRLPLQKVEGAPDVFVPNGFYSTVENPPYLPAWGSFSTLGNAARGAMAGKAWNTRLPYLEVQFSGYLGERKDLALGFRDLRTNRLTPFKPSRAPHERWRTEYVRAPSDSFRLEAVDDNPDYWFAFREPIEVGRLSFYAGYLLRRGLLLLLTGAGLFFLLLVHARLNAPPSPEEDEAFPSFGKTLRAHAPLAQTLFLVTAILLFRRPDALLEARFYAEDIAVFFREAHLHGTAAWFQPYSGYLNLLSHMAAYFIGTLFPIVAQPLAYNCFALLVVWVVIIKLFDPRVHLPFKPLLALAIVLVPHSGEVFLNFTNAQWFLPLLLLSLVLQDPPANRWQVTGDFTLLILCGLTGPFLLLLAPFFFCRLFFGEKSSYNGSLAAAVAMLCAAQVYFIRKTPLQAGGNHFDAAAALTMLGRRLGAYTVCGPHMAELLSAALPPVFFLILYTLPIFLASADGSLHRPALWVFLGLAAAIMVSTFFRFQGNMAALMAMHSGDRYFFLPRVMLAWALILVLGANRVGCVAAGALTLMALSAFTDFQLVSSFYPGWPAQAAALQRGEAISFPVNPPGVGMSVSFPAKLAAP